MADHWSYFNYPEILREADLRLAQARRYPEKLTDETNTLEYWIAWCAHANCAACLDRTS